MATQRDVQEEDVGGSLGAPVWVTGAPRTGTTFLAAALDVHPGIFMTNETRIMLLFSRLLNRSVDHRRQLATHRDQILDSLWAHIPALIEQIYVDLGAGPGQRWGDKYPQYSDGDLDPEALGTIDRLFPNGQYIHIVRDPRATVGSIKMKGWRDLDGAIRDWRVFVTHAREFGMAIGPDRYHELRYEDLMTAAVPTIRTALEFLHLPHDAGLEVFLDKEDRDRTRMSYPVGQPGAIGEAAWVGKLAPEEISRVEFELADLMVEFGYSPQSVRSTTD